MKDKRGKEREERDRKYLRLSKIEREKWEIEKKREEEEEGVEKKEWVSVCAKTCQPFLVSHKYTYSFDVYRHAYSNQRKHENEM